MLKYFIATTMFVFFLNISKAQTFTLYGSVTSNGGSVMSCTVTDVASGANTLTDVNGNFSLSVTVGDNLSFSVANFTVSKIKIIDETFRSFDISGPMHKMVTSGGISQSSLSTNNFWVGAKLGYNFAASQPQDYFVGSASIALNVFKNHFIKQSGNDTISNVFGVVGNIGNFKFNRDPTEDKNIQKLTQSINGLNIGLSFVHEWKFHDYSEASFFRYFLNSGARYTTYSNIGIDSETVNFTQWETTGGIEFEQKGFINGGNLTFSMGLSLLVFDKNQYQKIFNESKSKLIIVDQTLIIPISTNIGFFENGTYSMNVPASYLVGIILKP